MESDIDCGMIYHKQMAIHDLQNYNVIINEIDNMYVYNRKLEFKEKLKELIKESVVNNWESMDLWQTKFLLPNENKRSIELIINKLFLYEQNKTKRENLAKKLYTQLINRIQFASAELYDSNSSEKVKANLIKPNFTTSFDILKFEINYIKKYERLFDDGFLLMIRKYALNFITTPDGDVVDLNEIDEELQYHKEKSSIDYDDYSNGSYEDDEYIAPIDYEASIDEDLQDIYRSNAYSSQKQWGKKYKEFSTLFTEQNEYNPYLLVKNYSIKLLNTYNYLVENKIFTKTGNINGYSKLLLDIKEALRNSIKNKSELANETKVNTQINLILSLQKKEWKYIYQIINTDLSLENIKKYSEFDTVNLK